MSMFQNLLWDTPPYTTTYDVRTPQGTAGDIQRVGVTQNLANQYAAANANPGYGFTRLPSVGEQQYDLDNIIANSFNRTSASGGGNSGYANSLAGKAAADYRLNFLKQMSEVQNNARNALRSSVVASATPAYVPYKDFVTPGQQSLLSQFASKAAGAGGTAVGGMAAGGL